MPALNQTHANNLLNGSLAVAGQAFIASVSPMRVRLMTVNGSATAAGTEVVTGVSGYPSGTSAQAVSFGVASAGQSKNTTAYTVNNMPASGAGGIVGIEVWDSSPARKWYGPLTTPKVTNVGDTFSIAIDALTAALS